MKKFLCTLALLILLPFPAEGARDFDGINDYINIPANTVLRPTNITLSAWVKSSQATWNQFGCILSSRTSTNNGGYIIHPDPGTKQVTFYVNINNIWNFVSYAPADIEIWHLYTVTYDGTTLRGYVDGVEVGIPVSIIGGSVTYSGTANDVFIGFDNFGGRWCDAKIDDVRIYNRGLSASEAQELYSGKVNTIVDGMVAQWRMSESDTNPGFRDLSGNGNPGINNGSTPTSDTPPLFGQ